MRINNAFLLGIVTGIGIGYYLASDDKEAVIEDLKDTAGRVKDTLSEGINKGKKLIRDMKAEAEDFS
jgi:hypothetical protein